MSQDHRSPLSRRSYEDPRDHGAATGSGYPPLVAPGRPPAGWTGADGHSAPEPGHVPPGYGAQEVPGYGTPPGTTGLIGAEASRYGVPSSPPPTAPYGVPAGRPGHAGTAPPGHRFPAAGGYAATGHAGPEPSGFPAPAGYAGTGAPGFPNPAGYAGTAAPTHPVREAPRYGVPPTAPAHRVPGTPARSGPEDGRYRTRETPRYGAPEVPRQAGPPAWPASPPSAQQPTDGHPAVDGYSSQAVQNQIRQAVVHRAQYANAMHASHYWDLRRSKPVGPHALIFMYAGLDPAFTDPRRPYYEIKAASRLFRDGADVQDLPALLRELTEIAKDYLADGRVFDPVAQMTQAADEMPADARYVGVAVSTLLGTADEAVPDPVTAVGGMGIPGRVLVVLADHNLLMVERPARAHEQIEVYSTFPYTTGGGVEYRSWRGFSPEQQADPAWPWLQHLNQLVMTGQERKAAAGSGGRRRR